MKKLISCLTVTAWCLFSPNNGIARADVVITSFEVFFEDQLYDHWSDPYPETIIDSGDDSYTVTATGYGSNWTYIGDLGILGAGNTHIQLDVTLSSPSLAADGHLGPIITLVDADGTSYNYAWYGQLLGSHTLTMTIESPTWPSAAGTTPGLDLNAIEHLHLQLDPGGYGTTGPYTVSYEELRLVTIDGVLGDFNKDDLVDGRDFLAWQCGESPDALSSTDFATWQNAYNSGTLAAVSAVPEPASLGLIILANISILGLRRPPRLLV